VLKFHFHNKECGSLVVTNAINITQPREVSKFSLESFTPRLESYQISTYGTSPNAQQVFRLCPDKRRALAIMVEQ